MARIAPIALVDIEVAEMTSIVASPIVLAIAEEGKVQVVGIMMSVVPRDPIFTEVAREKGTVTMNPPAIKAAMEVLGLCQSMVGQGSRRNYGTYHGELASGPGGGQSFLYHGQVVGGCGDRRARLASMIGGYVYIGTSRSCPLVVIGGRGWRA